MASIPPDGQRSSNAESSHIVTSVTESNGRRGPIIVIPRVKQRSSQRLLGQDGDAVSAADVAVPDPDGPINPNHNSSLKKIDIVISQDVEASRTISNLSVPDPIPQNLPQNLTMALRMPPRFSKKIREKSSLETILETSSREASSPSHSPRSFSSNPPEAGGLYVATAVRMDRHVNFASYYDVDDPGKDEFHHEPLSRAPSPTSGIHYEVANRAYPQAKESSHDDGNPEDASPDTALDMRGRPHFRGSSDRDIQDCLLSEACPYGSVATQTELGEFGYGVVVGKRQWVEKWVSKLATKPSEYIKHSVPGLRKHRRPENIREYDSEPHLSSSSDDYKTDTEALTTASTLDELSERNLGKSVQMNNDQEKNSPAPHLHPSSGEDWTDTESSKSAASLLQLSRQEDDSLIFQLNSSPGEQTPSDLRVCFPKVVLEVPLSMIGISKRKLQLRPLTPSPNSQNRRNPSSNSRPFDCQVVIYEIIPDRYSKDIKFGRKLFKRHNEEEDHFFWHRIDHSHKLLDPLAERILRHYYKMNIRKSDTVIDLFSDRHAYFSRGEQNRIAGFGLVYDEMLCNRSLTEHYVQDLNKTPDLVSHFGKGTVHAVVCNLSVQYIIKPIELLQQILQVLVPGGTVHFTWAEDVFSEKSWAASRNWERREITQFIASWFFALDGFESVQEWVLVHGTYLEHQPTYLTCIKARKAKE